MTKIAKEIKDYWTAKTKNANFDAETLELVAKSLTADERYVLMLGYEHAKSLSRKEYNGYILTVNKAFNRHNDICKKNTLIGANEELILTDKSSLSELNIGIETLMECNQAGMYTIQDFSKANLVTLTLDTIHELTGAIIIYNAARD